MCCVIPILLAAGLLGGATWAAVAGVMPVVALALAAVTVVAWWATLRRAQTTGCAGGTCSCSC